MVEYIFGIFVEYDFFVIGTLKLKVIFLKNIKVDTFAYIPATLVYISTSVSLPLALGDLSFKELCRRLHVFLPVTSVYFSAFLW